MLIFSAQVKYHRIQKECKVIYHIESEIYYILFDNIMLNTQLNLRIFFGWVFIFGLEHTFSSRATL